MLLFTKLRGLFIVSVGAYMESKWFSNFNYPMQYLMSKVCALTTHIQRGDTDCEMSC